MVREAKAVFGVLKASFRVRFFMMRSLSGVLPDEQPSQPLKSRTRPSRTEAAAAFLGGCLPKKRTGEYGAGAPKGILDAEGPDGNVGFSNTDKEREWISLSTL